MRMSMGMKLEGINKEAKEIKKKKNTDYPLYKLAQEMSLEALVLSNLDKPIAKELSSNN